jgi:hypothetical protein
MTGVWSAVPRDGTLEARRLGDVDIDVVVVVVVVEGGS